jgi:hypothetical protein
MASLYHRAVERDGSEMARKGRLAVQRRNAATPNETRAGSARARQIQASRDG